MEIDIKDYNSQSSSDLELQLFKTLNVLRRDIDQGKLAIGFISENFEQINQTKISAKAIGLLLRTNLQLNTTKKKVNANKRRNVYALLWDDATEKIVSTVCDVSTSTESLPKRPILPIQPTIPKKIDLVDRKKITLNQSLTRVHTSQKRKIASVITLLKKWVITCLNGLRRKAPSIVKKTASR